MMSLFRVNKAIQELDEIDNIVITPFGPISFDIYFDNHHMSNDDLEGKQYRITNKSKLTRWINGKYEVELLINEPDIVLPEHMEIDKCVAAIWRFRLKSNIKKVYMEVKLIDEDLNFGSYGLEPGEDLYSIGYETKDYNLHIGTQDEAVLVYRKEIGDYFPVEIPNKDQYYYPFVNVVNGIGLLLEDIDEAEICQVHFIISWAKYKEWDLSSWFVVDKKTRELLPECVEY